MRAVVPAFLLAGPQPDRGSPLEGQAHPKEVGARTEETMIEAMGLALAAVSAKDAKGYFAHCGYRTPAQHL